MRASLKDVAERAGVSIKTVSNVVNNYPHVTPAMRARVQAAIDELGYRPNLTARHLRGGRTGIIALAVPELGNPYFAELAGAVIDAAAEHEFTVLLDHTRGDREQEILVSQGFRGRVIDGLILSPLALEAEDLQGRSDDVPLVLLGEREYDLPFDHIAIDNVAASRCAVRHLLGRGRTRIAYLGVRTDSVNRPAHLRLDGWRAELAAAGVPAPDSLVVPVGGWDRDDGARAMAELLDSGVRPDAVFAFNDLIAIGAMRVLHERGLRVPWDVAVVGFDDIAEGRFGAVTLTTVSPDKQAIAKMAVASLLRSLSGREEPGGRELTAAFELVERESTLGRR
ncbi:LacI family transcriptional regulator [Streptomyces spinosirectus]|uniref:LacI family DNA-binding transcriptional regulator n=1 Tax=Streptomyces TaxID=1883 RepID=UPI000D35074B|nr:MULTISPECIES: LacI family DNA-binding transcriptional regulator [Streptomyces]MBY8341047.1 LacI family DNA-binding transcriptional regulator [Streptomyces plumbidurans]PTM89986.1 LacI family transcriptional regulator [Streptomyces sp. VMFN-G11Ma]UIR22343.1 LacI family transcriptional regulator [Streptomyces spinosirectus]